MIAPTPNTAEAVRFLEMFFEGQRCVLTAISLDKKTIETRTFNNPSDTYAWIEARNGKVNLYFSVNPTIRPVTSKPKKKDIAGLRWLHVDCDPRHGEDLMAERVRILGSLRAYQPPPTIIVDSGGGYQAFWKLDRLYPTDGDEAKAIEYERYNRKIEMDLGADSCHDICRIMRLPGTVNCPDAKKQSKGRTAALAKIIWGSP